MEGKVSAGHVADAPSVLVSFLPYILPSKSAFPPSPSLPQLPDPLRGKPLVHREMSAIVMPVGSVILTVMTRLNPRPDRTT